MKPLSIRAITVLGCMLLLTSCGKKPEKAGVVSDADSKPEGGTLQAVIGYGTGATQVKAGQDAAKKLKAIEASRNAQMQEVAE